MLKDLSKVDFKEIYARSRSNLFSPSQDLFKEAFPAKYLDDSKLPISTADFLQNWSLPRWSHTMTLGGFTISQKNDPKNGTIQWFPKLEEWAWLSEHATPIPTELNHSVVFGSGEGAELGVNRTIVGHGKGGPICIKQNGSLVFYPEDDNYLEYAVNTDVKKLFYCLVFFQTMTKLSRKKNKKDTHLLCTVRPDYCDTIYEEMRAIDPKAIESPLSFWPLMLDLACFKHPLANGRRRYNFGG